MVLSVEMKEVTIIESPVTKRYVKPGSKGKIDHNRIRVNGIWFDYSPAHWKVVTDEEKEQSFIESAIAAAKERSYLYDWKFSNLIEAYAVGEVVAMEWLMKAKRFKRRPDGWDYKQ